MRFQFSNFYPCMLSHDGIFYYTPENLYQAAKTTDREIRKHISTLTPGQAKKFGKTLDIRPDWEQIKLPTMRYIQQKRFENLFWREQLIGTEDQELVEYNVWHDRFWGICTCEKCNKTGENHLGKIIMEIRFDLLHQ